MRSDLAAVLVATLPGWVWSAPSLSSCGGDSDLLRSPVFEVSPDPIDPAKPFSITAAGDLAQALTNGTVSLDLDAKVKLLGETLLDDKVKTAERFEFLPGFEAGATKLVVGPVALPGKVPGSLDVTGKVVVTDVSGAQVTCIAVDFKIELMAARVSSAHESARPTEPWAPAATALAPRSCSKPGDHMKDVKVSGSGGVVEMHATMDEDLKQMSFDSELLVKYGFFKIPISISIPVSFTPGIKKGPISIKCASSGGAGSVGTAARALPEISGEVVWNDDGKEEVACLHFDEGSGASGAQEELLVI